MDRVVLRLTVPFSTGYENAHRTERFTQAVSFVKSIFRDDRRKTTRTPLPIRTDEYGRSTKQRLFSLRRTEQRYVAIVENIPNFSTRVI